MNVSLDRLTERYVAEVQGYIGQLESGSAERDNRVGLASLQMDFVSEGLETDNPDTTVLNEAIDFSIVNLN